MFYSGRVHNSCKGMPMRAIQIALATAVCCAPIATVVQAQKPLAPNDSMVVSTAWLAAHLTDPKVVLIEVTMDAKPTAEGHIPGARQLPYQEFTTKRDGLSSEIPGVDSLKAKLETLGVADDSRVVVYALHAPMATRLLMTLDYLGHQKFSYLDGGLAKWRVEGRAVTQETIVVVRRTFTPRLHPEIVVSADWITGHIDKPGLSLIDTRTDGEYNGTGNRSGMPSAGHLDGARQLEWESLFRSENPLLLKDRAELSKLYADRVQSGDTVVTYCWVGYRASATYFAARLLGYDAKFYDGSYQDWQMRKLPTKMGSAP